MENINKRGISEGCLLRSRAQTSFEYMLITAGIILLVVTVVLVTQNVLSSSANATNGSISFYNASVANFSISPTPLPDFPCANPCTDNPSCTTLCGPAGTGHSWVCTQFSGVKLCVKS